MSRIYEALKQSDQSTPCSIVELIEADQPQLASPARLENKPASPVEYEQLSTEPKPAPPAARPIRPEYRTATLRLAPGAPVFPFDGSHPQAAEQYRILRTNILQHGTNPKVVAVSSATPRDGKTVTAINLAGILSVQSETRVLIVEADLRRSTIAKVLGINRGPGLAEVLLGHCRLEDAIVRIEQLPNLHVLPSGEVTVNPAELLDSGSWRSLVASLRQQFSFVILDTTPMDAVSDFRIVQQVCDGLLIVVRPDNTNRTAFRRALEFEGSQKLLGTVINGVSDWFAWKTQDSYSYYGEGPAKASFAKRE